MDADGSFTYTPDIAFAGEDEFFYQLSDGAATSMRDGAAAAYVVQWAWLAAGVPSMIMPRWAGDPAASEALLAEFHRRLTSGADLP